MLYNLLIPFLAVFGIGIVVGAIVLYIGFRIGLTITANSEHNVEREVKKPSLRHRREQRKLSKQQEDASRRMQAILDNIDAYDGTEKGQKEID